MMMVVVMGVIIMMYMVMVVVMMMFLLRVLLLLQHRQWHSLQTERMMKMTKQEQRKATQDIVNIRTLCHNNRDVQDIVNIQTTIVMLKSKKNTPYIHR